MNPSKLTRVFSQPYDVMLMHDLREGKPLAMVTVSPNGHACVKMALWALLFVDGDTFIKFPTFENCVLSCDQVWDWLVTGTELHLPKTTRKNSTLIKRKELPMSDSTCTAYIELRPILRNLFGWKHVT